MCAGSQSTPSRPNLSFIKELAATRKGVTYEEDAVEETPTPSEENPYIVVSRALKTGHLVKTSKSIGKKSTPGNSRQRKFRLTNEALEYLHTFSHVSLMRERGGYFGHQI